MLRAALYARVSTNDQQTLPMQSRALREYAARRGWTITVQIREVGSGAVKREAREKLLEAARRREIDVVLVWRLDRWGRSVTDLLATLQELEHLGVGFVSLTETLDLTTPAGRAMAGLLAVFAAFERDPNPVHLGPSNPFSQAERPEQYYLFTPSLPHDLFTHACRKLTENCTERSPVQGLMIRNHNLSERGFAAQDHVTAFLAPDGKTRSRESPHALPARDWRELAHTASRSASNLSSGTARPSVRRASI
jgi:hypothetical protein